MIVQTQIRLLREHPVDLRRDLELLTGRGYSSQVSRQPFSIVNYFGEMLQENKREKELLNLFALDHTQQRARVFARFLSDQYECAASTPRRKHLLKRNIKTQRSELQRSVSLGHLPRLPRHDIAQCAMSHRYAFWSAGRARRIDHISQIVVVNL